MKRLIGKLTGVACLLFGVLGASSAWGVDCCTWSQVKENLEVGYSVRLMQDIAQDGGNSQWITQTAGPVTLDLHGHVITQGASDGASYIACDSVGKVQLTIKDSVGNGAIVGNPTVTTMSGSGGGGFCLTKANSVLLLQSGTLRDFRLTASGKNGGCVYIGPEAFFKISGGTISGCTTAGDGGAVYNAGTFTMNGGAIKDCTATGSGGGVCNAAAGTATVCRGTITGCSATNGGAIFNAGVLTLNSEIDTSTGCSATGSGGWIYNGGTFYMTDGSVPDYDMEADPWSTYVPTKIINGSFDAEPWMVFAHQGITYASCPFENTQDNPKWTVSDKVFNPVDGGWNTTETTAWRMNLFEYVKTGHSEREHNPNISQANGYIELSCCSAAAVYQDLTTHGGDVIRWTLKHAVTTVDCGNETQALRVEIGAPIRDADGSVVDADGVGNDINTKIADDSLAIFRNTGVTGRSGSASTLGCAGSDMTNLCLSVSTQADGWFTASGAYVVPEGLDVSRFALVPEATDSAVGNLLDDLTFATLIGNLQALLNDDGSVTISGYWGESDASKTLMIKIGDGEAEAIDMSDVTCRNFMATVSADKIGRADSLEVYHQDFETAKRTVQIGWAVALNLNATDATCARLTQYRSGAMTVLPIPTRTGFAFAGWFDNDGLTGDAVAFIPAEATGAKAFWAKWNALVQVGDDAWACVTDGVCTVSGTGETWSYESAGKSPLWRCANAITNLVVEDGVTGIGARFFENMWFLADVTLGADVTNVAARAFKKCYGLTNVVSLATKASRVGDYAFAGCHSLQTLDFGEEGKPEFGEGAYTFRTVICMRDGIPDIYPVPKLTMGNYDPVKQGSNDLVNWVEIDDATKKDYRFFKIILEPKK